MTKHFRNIILIGLAMLLLTACAAPTAQPVVVPEEEITSTPIVIVVTATPMPATETEKATATAAKPTMTNTPTTPGAFDKNGKAIVSNSSIIISNIKTSGAEQAYITWTATGTFASGFKIYYSSSVVNPLMGGGNSEYSISDGTARSAFITGVPGTTYNYRICSFNGSTCEFYSKSYSFTFPAATSTP